MVCGVVCRSGFRCRRICRYITPPRGWGSCSGEFILVDTLLLLPVLHSTLAPVRRRQHSRGRRKGISPHHREVVARDPGVVNGGGGETRGRHDSQSRRRQTVARNRQERNAETETETETETEVGAPQQLSISVDSYNPRRRTSPGLRCVRGALLLARLRSPPHRRTSHRSPGF